MERDERCIAALEEIAAACPGRLTIVPADALALDEARLFAELGVSGPMRFASNLPYNIGSALLVKWLTGQSWPPVMAEPDADVPARSGRAADRRSPRPNPMDGCRC